MGGFYETNYIVHYLYHNMFSIDDDGNGRRGAAASER